MGPDDKITSERRSKRRMAVDVQQAGPSGLNNCELNTPKRPNAGKLHRSWAKKSGHKEKCTAPPCEVYDTSYLTMMKTTDAEGASIETSVVPILDTWRNEWNKGVQVPVAEQYGDGAKLKEVAYRDVPSLRDSVPMAWKRPRGYIRLQKDSFYSPSAHHYSDAAARARNVCSYECDDFDRAWLQLVNARRKRTGLPPIGVEKLEQVLEWCEWQCTRRVEKMVRDPTAAHAANFGANLGREFDDDAACDVCLSRDHEHSDAILFCDGCDLAVHQSCYGVECVPTGSWLCRPCALLHPGATVKCVLCPKVGGAMKCTEGADKWCHVACALWVPEVRFGDPELLEPIDNLPSVPQSRFTLRCSVCGESHSGACIQCDMRQCRAAYHVTCAQRGGLEMRWYQGDDGELRRVSYCKRHSTKQKARMFVGHHPSSSIISPLKSDERARLHATPVNDFTGNLTPDKQPTGGGRLSSLSDADMDVESMVSPRKRRARRVRKLHTAFYRMLDPADCTLTLNVPAELVCELFEYWKLRRARNNGGPLITSRDDEQEEFMAHEDELLMRRVRMLVAMRQNLEKARNLSYMLMRREKLKRQHVNLVEEIFMHLKGTVDEPTVKLSRREAAKLSTLLDSQSYYDDLHESNPYLVDELATRIWTEQETSQEESRPFSPAEHHQRATNHHPVRSEDLSDAPRRSVKSVNVCKLTVNISPTRMPRAITRDRLRSAEKDYWQKRFQKFSHKYGITLSFQRSTSSQANHENSMQNGPASLRKIDGVNRSPRRVSRLAL